ncbi:RNase adapter RapZ [Micrococcales bacterium 31B]|nr:RNase adapter RapZ [Micrococcales bacterium 31B]
MSIPSQPSPQTHAERPEYRNPQASEVLIVTGMSGAGRATAGRALEDMGWYVIDNLPPELIITVTDYVRDDSDLSSKIAVIVDVRAKNFFHDLNRVFDQLTAAGTPYRIIFLDATEDILVRRFEQNRRPHPLQGDSRLTDGISLERIMTATMREKADLLIDTSVINVHQLAQTIRANFSGPITDLRVTVMSFGFKYGIPLDADQVADVRFLPNPYWQPELRELTGRDLPVSTYVLGRPGAQEFISAYHAALLPALNNYVHESKNYATIAIGCTGGKHRSVAITEKLGELLRVDGFEVRTTHRDLGRE